MKREDDGSQEWLDQLIRNRIRGQMPTSAENRRLIEIDPNNISDPVLRERFIAAKQAGLIARERYSKSPHFGPAHLGGKAVEASIARGYEISADIDAMTTAIEAKHLQQRQILNEVDSAEAQLQRMPNSARNQALQTLDALQNRRAAFPNHNLVRLNEIGNANFMQPQQQMQAQQQVQTCRLLDGHPCFRALQTNAYGSPVILARAVGQIVPQVSMQEYVVRGVKNVYIVPPNQTMVDMNAIQRNPQMCAQLVEVMAPPATGLGVFLVPREALAIPQNNPYGQQRSIITDSYQRQQPQQQLPQQFINRAFQSPQQQQPAQGVRPAQPGNGRGLIRG